MVSVTKDKTMSTVLNDKPRLRHVRRPDTPRTTKLKQKLAESPYMPALDNMPKFLRYGKWSPLSYLFLFFMTFYIFYTAFDALNEFPIYNKTQIYETVNYFGAIWRLICCIYGISINIVLINYAGFWPLSTFTIMSWNLFTLRYFFTGWYIFVFFVF